MNYYNTLNLKKEPFSNSPDPDLFFQSRQHIYCLQQVEISIRLRRGLNVVIGDVGTGKTTLCRQLVRRFSHEPETEVHLLLDPHFGNTTEFLSSVHQMLARSDLAGSASDRQLKEIIKQNLYLKGFDENETVILIIDEGQKIPDFCLEVLREFLNFETNRNKLLQVVIFAQKEFSRTLREHPNFTDRINFFQILKPLNFADTKRMIQFRLKKSGRQDSTPSFFTPPALWAVYRYTAGYPRKIVTLCHIALMTMIIQKRVRVGWATVRFCARRSVSLPLIKKRRVFAAAIAAGLLVGVLTAGPVFEIMNVSLPWRAGGYSLTCRQHEAFGSSSLESNPAAVMPDDPLLRSNRSPGPFLEPSENCLPADCGARETTRETNVPVQQGLARAGIRPEILGQLAVGPDQTLGQMIRKVYGVFNYHYLRSVRRSNPQLDDPDRVDVGQLITLPAIPVRPAAPAAKFCWVRVGQKNELTAAMHALSALSGQLPSVGMVACWNHREGLKFVLVLKEAFPDRVSALNRLKNLPPAVIPEAALVSLPDSGDILFTDPFFGKQVACASMVATQGARGSSN